MAVLAFGLVGSALGGTLIGGAIGSQIGWFLGSMIGNALFPPPAQEGPRLSDLKMTTSAYGQAIPLVYGTARVAGNCFWSTDKVEHKHTQKAGKGGGQKVNSYTYTISIAFLLCQGPIAGVVKIWANGVLIWSSNGNSAGALIASSKLASAIRIYTGAEDQMPDAFMQAHDGVESTPAYRGTAYILFQDLDLTDYGGQIPNFEFEVVAHGASVGDPNDPTAGGRVISSSFYQPHSLATQGGGRLYDVFTTANYSAGSSYGYVRPMAAHGGMLDVVCDGVLAYVDGDGTQLPIAMPACNGLRWTVDADGNLVSSGIRSEYPSSISYMRLPPSGEPFGQAYEIMALGKCGGGDMYIDRTAPKSLVAPFNVADAGEYPTARQTFIYRAADGGEFPADVNGQVPLIGSSTFMTGASTSVDGRWLMVITGDATNPSQHWHRFSCSGSSQTLDASGTIDPSAAGMASGWGVQGSNYASAACLEEDGAHLWTGATSNAVPWGGIGCLEIGSDGVMRQIYAYHYPDHPDLYTGPRLTAIDAPGLYATSGVCFAAGWYRVAALTRNPTVVRGALTLADVVFDICMRAGLQPGDVDVSQLTDPITGVVYGQQMTYRSMLEPLRTAYFFDGIETDGKLVFIKRGGSVVANIAEDELAAHDGMSLNPPPDQWKLTRQQVLELPCKVTVDYFATNADFQDGSQYDQRQGVRNQNTMKLQLPIALDDNQARAIAMVNNYMVWANRDTFEFATDRSYSHLNPTDIISVMKDGERVIARIMKRTDGGNGIVDFVAVKENPSVYTQIAQGGIVRGGTQSISLPSPTELVVFDAPALQDSSGAHPTAFIAANGYDTSWNGADIYRSIDGGQNYVDIDTSVTSPSVMGKAISVLGAPDSYGLFDEKNTVDVYLNNSAAELNSDTEANVLNGSNAAMVGGELIGFKVATLTGPRQYRLSGLLRGRLGTEDQSKIHASGEDFILLKKNAISEEQIDSSYIGQQILSKAVTFGLSQADARPAQFQFKARNMRPLTPIRVNATCNTAGGDWRIAWTRRARTGAVWRDFVDAPIGETAETYDVDIVVETGSSAGNYVIRTAHVTSPSFTYTAAMQAADFGGAQATIYYRVYQTNGVVGRSPDSIFMSPALSPYFLGYYKSSYQAPAYSGGPFTAPVVVTSSWTALYHFDGPNGSTTTSDSSANNYSLTFTGGPTLSTAAPALGTANAHFPGSGYGTLDPAVSNIPAGDFTITMRFKSTISGAYRTLLCRSVGGFAAGAWTIMLSDGSGNGRPQLYWADYSTGAPFMTATAAGYNDGAWHTLAWTREGNVHRLFLDGALSATTTTSAAFTPSTNGMTLGEDLVFGGRTYAGDIDELAILYGTCLYNANYTPATAPFA